MGEINVELHTLADYLTSRRAAILEAWRNAIKRDPSLMTGESLPRLQLFDHIPAMLATFERELRNSPAGEVALAADAAQESAAAHGLQRWQQGYDLREVTRELGKLNECVVGELDGYTAPPLGRALQHRDRGKRRTILPASAAGGCGPRQGSGERARRDPGFGAAASRLMETGGA
jgi:hypothetical protein